MGREGLILMLAAGADGPYPLDPIRVMKACFIVSRSGRPQWREQFCFEPYDYGPFDTSVYRARDALIAKGLLSVAAGRFPSYALTEDGESRVGEIERSLDAKSRGWLQSVGHYVTSLSFSDLLDAINERFPGVR